MAAHDQPASVLNRSVPGGPDQTGAYVPRELLGTIIAGRYKLLEAIGEGGMGTVWVAEQTQPVRRKVALKLITAGMDSNSVLARFEAERQALAMMDHPNIAKVLDGGLTESGRPFFVMEYVKGVPITEYCDANRLSVPERLNLFVQVCRAVPHAHQKGIIHRDLKPSNILVAPYDDKPVPKVIDFGLAKAMHQSLTERTLHTAHETVLGTPLYMSPEQAQLNNLDVDTRSDIYSLGVLLYELLTGTTPLEKKRFKEAAWDEIKRIIREEEAPRPSTRLSSSNTLASLAAGRQIEPAKLTKLVRGELDWIVMKALEKDRSRRYETANGFAMDVQRYLAGESVLAVPPSAGYRLRKFARKHRAGLTTAAAIALLLLMGVTVSSWQAVRATRAEVEQTRQREIAEANERQALDAQLGEAKQRQAAEEQRQKAVSQELVARQRAYAADMNLAQQALAMNNFGRAKMLLNRYQPQPGQQDLRGWEWRFLWTQCKSDAVASLRLPENTDHVTSVAVSPDGKWVTTGNWVDSSLPVFDWETKKKVPYDPGIVSGRYVAFSPETPLIAFPMSANGKFSVRLWDAEKKQVVKDLQLGGRSGRLAFSADGKTLVTTSGPPESKITLWGVPDGEPIKSYPIGTLGGQGMQVPLAIARDLSVAAYASSDHPNTIEVIDLATGQKRWSVPAGEGEILALALSHDGKILASGSSNPESRIRLWDVATGKSIGRPIEGHRAWVSGLLFWPDGKTLASSSADQTVRLWDLTDPANVLPIRTLQGHKHEVWSLALMPDNRHLLSGSKDNELLVWDTANVRRERGAIRLSEKLINWRFAPDGKSILTLDRQGRLARRTGHDFQESETVIDVGAIEVGSLARSNTVQLAQLKRESLAMMELAQVLHWQGDSHAFFIHRRGRAGAVAHGRTPPGPQTHYPPRPHRRRLAAHGPCPPPLPAPARLVHGLVRHRPRLVLPRQLPPGLQMVAALPPPGHPRTLDLLRGPPAAGRRAPAPVDPAGGRTPGHAADPGGLLPRPAADGPGRLRGRCPRHPGQCPRLRSARQPLQPHGLPPGPRPGPVRGRHPRAVAHADQTLPPWRSHDGAGAGALPPGGHAAAVGPQLSYNLLLQVRLRGAHLLARIQSNLVFRPLRRLRDGSYLAKRYPSPRHRDRDEGGLKVRIIEYTFADPGRPGSGEKHRLLTTLLSATHHPAQRVIVLYHERWEEEVTIDELKTHQWERPVLRSETPAGVVQEIQGLLLAHYVVRVLMAEAARRQDLPPRRLSFTGTLKVLRCRLPGCPKSRAGLRRWYADLLAEVAEEVLEERRNRINPRVIKRKMSNWRKKRPEHRHTPQPTKQFRESIVLVQGTG